MHELGRSRGQRGQGTVEYVALILLVAVVLAGIVTATKQAKFGDKGLAEAIVTQLAAWGKDLNTMAPDESLWPSANNPAGLTSGTFYGNLQRYLKKAGLTRAGVHVFRHSGAKLRRDVGESVEDVSRFLDHSSLAVTTVYLRRLEGQADTGWAKVAAAIGV